MGNIAATMNPQRVRMLQQPDNDEQFQQPLAESKPSAIRVTGANVLALSEHSSISNRLNQSRAEPRSSAIPTKRSYSDFENDKDYQDEPRKYDRYRPHQNSLKYDKRLERQVPPLFPPAPLRNHHTSYLTNLLQTRPLKFILEPFLSRKVVTRPKIYMRQVTDAGLILTEIIRNSGNLPIVRLPKLKEADRSITHTDQGVNREISRTTHGVLLEEIWCELSPAQKYDVARQLRKLILQMQRVTNSAGKRQLGSLFSGKYSLMLDRHQKSTYWAVRSQPTIDMFVAFLVSSFYSTVPGPIAANAAGMLKKKCPLVLSHAEICPKNIVMDQCRIIGITGWDCAGWYPEWWDYVKFFEARTSEENHDWYEYAGEIFDRHFPAELAAYQGVARCQTP